MANWRDFEDETVEWLNDAFREYAHFTLEGGFDSTVSDILVKTDGGDSFYIDAKLCPAQSGQFVLLPNIKTGTFDYSLSNATPLNAAAQEIISFMNDSFEDFKAAGTRGEEILFENAEDVFANWIVSAYQNKGVRYIFTNNYTILPIEDFQKHFFISAKYRVKRSGSSDVGKRRAEKILQNTSLGEYRISGYRVSKSKLFVKSPLDLHNRRFIYDGYEYMFSKRDSEFEVRKLSNTFNANVIFSIKSKGVSGLTQEQFVERLCN